MGNRTPELHCAPPGSGEVSLPPGKHRRHTSPEIIHKEQFMMRIRTQTRISQVNKSEDSPGSNPATSRTLVTQVFYWIGHRSGSMMTRVGYGGHWSMWMGGWVWFFFDRNGQRKHGSQSAQVVFQVSGEVLPSPNSQRENRQKLWIKRYPAMQRLKQNHWPIDLWMMIQSDADGSMIPRMITQSFQWDDLIDSIWNQQISYWIPPANMLMKSY